MDMTHSHGSRDPHDLLVAISMKEGAGKHRPSSSSYGKLTNLNEE